MSDRKNTEQVQDSIRLSELSQDVGEANELPAKDRARLRLAGWILGALFLLVCGSVVVLIWGPEDRLPYATEFFNYVKAAVPPLVTLILGFWFQANNE